MYASTKCREKFSLRLIETIIGRALPTVLLAAAAMPASASIGFVQGGYATPQSHKASVSVALSQAQLAGDFNIVVVGWNDTSATISSVTDQSGNAYLLTVGPTLQSRFASQSIYYAKNIASATAGANTVTVTFSKAAAYPGIRVLEYSGLDPNNPVDVTAAGNGRSATSSSGAVTTTNPTDMLFAANLVQTLTSGAGSGFSARLLTVPDGDIVEDKMVTTAGSYTASAPLSSAGKWIMQMVAFRAASSAALATYSISGAVTGSGATVTLSGASSATTTVAAGGTYTFSGLKSGSYSVTPSQPGYTFSPASTSVTITNTNVTGINFAGTALTYSISGTVTGSGATVTLSGGSSATTTVAAGSTYTFSGLKNGTYTVTPSQSGYTFSPGSAAVTVGSANVAGVNFTGSASAGTYSISGTVTGAAATVTLSGTSSATATVAAGGVFTFSGLKNGSYTVTPSQSGYTFSPASTSVTVSGANVSGINFAGTALTYSISGTLTGSAATVTLSGASSATTAVAAGGTYTFSALKSGSYTVTPSHSGYTFSPAATSVTITNANVTGVNFTGSAVTSTYSITGTVTGSAATVTLSGASSGTTTVAAGGTYIFSGLANGSYVASASQSGYSFSPATASMSINGANVTGVNFTATAMPPSVSLSWTASSSPNIAGYNIYRGSVSGGPYALINTSLISGTNYTDTNVTAGQTYYYVTTAVDGSDDQSANSNQAVATVP